MDVTDEHGLTALAWVVRPSGGSLAALDLLLAAGADPNHRGRDHQALRPLCFEGLSSAHERGLAERSARRLVEAGYRPRPTDAPEGSPDVADIRRACRGLDAEELLAVEEEACRWARARWEARPGAPPALPDDAGGAEALRALDALLAPAMRPTSTVGAVSTVTIVKALRNRLARRLGVEPDAPPELVICQAVHGARREERWSLPEDLVLRALIARDAGPADNI